MCVCVCVCVCVLSIMWTACRRQIKQSSPLPGASNAITVALGANNKTQLRGSDSAVIILSNLRYLDPNQGLLPLHAVSGGRGGHNLFCVPDANVNGSALVLDANRLKLSLCRRAAMEPNVIYSFSFFLVNPQEERDAETVFVEAGLAGLPTYMPATKLTNSLAPAGGMLAGASPLLVRVPRILSHSIGQSVPIVGKLNELTVTIATNLQLRRHDGWSISISGLNGTAQTSDLVELRAVPARGSVSGLFCQSGVSDRGAWVVRGGEAMLRLDLCPNMAFAAEYDHVFSFQVLNGEAPQASPSVSIFIHGSSAVALEPRRMLTTNATGGFTPPMRRGVAGGGMPLMLLKPRFDVCDVTQSNPVTSGGNVLTVSLVSNLDVLPSDAVVITISNLTGAAAASPLDLSRVPGGNGAELLFCDGSSITSGKFLPSGQGQAEPQVLFSLCPSSRLKADTTYVFSFNVENPPHAQPAPDVMISAHGWLVFDAVPTSAPQQPVRGLPDAAKPMTVVVPQFLDRKIGQLNPAAGLSNIISLTLTPNVDLYASHASAITIGGIPANPHYPAEQATRISILGGSALRNRVLGRLSPLPAPATSVDAGSWDARQGVITFFVAKNQKLAGQERYVIDFEILNRDMAVDTPDLWVEASADSPFLRTALEHPHQPAAGVQNGANAFYVTRPVILVLPLLQYALDLSVSLG